MSVFAAARWIEATGADKWCLAVLSGALTFGFPIAGFVLSLAAFLAVATQYSPAELRPEFAPPKDIG